MKPGLKDVCKSLFKFSLPQIPNGDLPNILSHYRNVCFCPFPIKITPIARFLLLFTLFLISRACAYSHVMYYVLFHLGELQAQFTGDQSSTRVLVYIDVFMWLLMYFYYVPADMLLLNRGFHRAARVLFRLVIENTRNVHYKSGRRCMFLILFNEVFVQISVLYCIFTSIWLAMDDFTQIFARLPVYFHTHTNRLINWAIVSITIIGANTCIAFLLVFPACLAYWIGEMLENISRDALVQNRNANSSDNMRNLLKRYTNLYIAVREVNKCLAIPTFILHGTLTFQQMAEAFTLFTLRDSGMDSGVSVFFDLLVSLYFS